MLEFNIIIPDLFLEQILNSHTFNQYIKIAKLYRYLNSSTQISTLDDLFLFEPNWISQIINSSLRNKKSSHLLENNEEKNSVKLIYDYYEYLLKRNSDMFNKKTTIKFDDTGFVYNYLSSIYRIILKSMSEH